MAKKTKAEEGSSVAPAAPAAPAPTAPESAPIDSAPPDAFGGGEPVKSQQPKPEPAKSEAAANPAAVDLEADADPAQGGASGPEASTPELAKPELVKPEAAPPRSGAEIRAADPFQLTPEEIERDLATLADLPAQRQALTDAYTGAIKERDAALKDLSAKINHALDAKRRFEERYAVLGERQRLLLAAKDKLARDAAKAAEQAEKDAKHNAELARQRGVRELQARKDTMTDQELARHREQRQRDIAEARKAGQLAAAS